MAEFYGDEVNFLVLPHGSEGELDELEAILESGHEICAIFTEFPVGPLLTCVSLHRIRNIADRYGLVVVCNDTMGTSFSLNLLPAPDLLIISLTKMFSGAGDATGGSVVFNPKSRHHEGLFNAMFPRYQYSMYPGDMHTLAGNCIGFEHRVSVCSHNAERVAALLTSRNDLVSDTLSRYPPLPRRAFADSDDRTGETCLVPIIWQLKADVRPAEEKKSKSRKWLWLLAQR